MPFEPVNDDLLTLRTPLSPERAAGPRAIEPGPSTVGAAFRSQNVIGSILASKAYSGMAPVESNHNPLDLIKGTIYEQEYDDYFVGSASEAETRARMAQIDMELKDRETVDKAGTFGTIASIAAGTIDPTIFLPGGEVVRGAKGVYSALRTARNVGLAGAAAVGAQEALLQGSQATRTTGESLANIGAATIFAGILGSAAAKYLSAAERKAGVKALESIRSELRSTTSLTSAGADVADPRAALPVEMLGQRSLVPEPVGRAYDATRRFLERGGEVPVAGKVLGPIGKLASKVIGTPEFLIKESGPLTRTFYSSSPTAIRVAADLAESPTEFKFNEVGVPTSANGPAVETVARMAIDGARYKIGQELDRLFKSYFFGDNVSFGKARAALAQATGRNPEGRLGYREFKASVADAMMNGDIHEIPEVEAAAKYLRKEVFDPWKEAAIRAKLLPEGVETKTAQSYFMRVYDKEKIIARRPQALKVISDWLESDQSVKAQTKDRLQDNRDMRADVLRKLRRVDRRLETIAARTSDVESRLEERGMEAGKATARLARVADRAAEARAALEDARGFLADLQEADSTPAIQKQIKALQRDIASLERQARPLKEEDLADIDKAERAELRQILTGDNRRLAKMLTGKAKPPAPPSFYKWLVKQGGVKDEGGDLGADLPRGLKKRDGLQWDDLQTKLGEEFPELKAQYLGDAAKPTEDFSNEIRAAIQDSIAGNEPEWFLSAKWDDADRLLAESYAAIEDAASKAGIEFKSLDDVAHFLRGERDDAVTEADYDRMIAEIESSPASMDFRVAGEDARKQIDIRQGSLKVIADSLRKAKRNLGKAKEGAGKGDVRLDEAGKVVDRNLGRLGILDERSSRLATQQELLALVRKDLSDRMDALRLAAEEDILRWEGKSASEAKAALKARDEAERLRGLKKEAGVYEGKDARLTGADKPVDRAIRRILRSERDKSREELESLAHEIIDRILGSPDGRLPYDIPSGGPRVGAPSDMPPPRGPLAARQFMIPDELIKDFLVRDVEQVAHTYLGSIVPDVLLTERFGDVDMTMQFRQINEEYAKRMVEAQTEAERTALRREQEQVITDMAAMRDRTRGTYGYTSDTVMRNAARIAGALGSVNTLADMGGSAIAQITDLAGGVYRYGFGSVFKNGFFPMVNGLMEKNSTFREAVRQYKALGIGIDMHFNTRNLDEVGEQYHPRTRGERALRAAAQGYMVANLSAPMTDAAKAIAAVTIGNEILQATAAVAAGKATKKQITSLAASSIDQTMAERIAKNFAEGGAIKDGVYLPNTADWSDAGARLAFEAAVSREANIAVVTPGQEKALWLSNPVLKIFGQFKAFIASSSVRILAANLQRRDAQSLQGLMASVVLGMIGYKVYSAVTGQDTSDRWQDWVKEGVSRAGVLGWLDEGNSFASKFTRGQLDLYRAIGADRPLSRYASRGVLGAILGPTAGKVENAAQAAAALASGEFVSSDIRAARRLLPLQNLWYIRRLLNEVEAGFADAMGIPARAER